jgi:hypothetical protein
VIAAGLSLPYVAIAGAAASSGGLIAILFNVRNPADGTERPFRG